MGGLIWLASYPKSGNTWTRNFLHNLMGVMHGTAEETQDINRMNRLTTWELAGRWYEPVLGKPVGEATLEETAAARMAAQEAIAAATPDLVFVKTHHALVLSHGVPTINANVTAGAVYIVRNPLDVTISLANHMGIDLDAAIVEMGRTGNVVPNGPHSAYEAYGSWSLHVESWTRKPQRTLFVMRYEDMLTRGPETFGRLARFLKQPASAAQIKEAMELSSFRRLQEKEAESGFVEKPKTAEKFFRKGKAEQWREELSEAQVARVVADHHVQMRRFGYLTDELETLAPKCEPEAGRGA